MRAPGSPTPDRRRSIGAANWLIAAAVAATLLITGLFGSLPATHLAWLGCVLAVISGSVLIALSHAPDLVLAVTGLGTLGCLAIGFEVPAVAFLVAVYGAFRAGHRISAVLAALVMLVSAPLVLMIGGIGWSAALAQSREALPLAWLIAAAAAGEALRQAERRAEDAERTREEAARHRADEERLHIARELHDSLTHQMSVIRLQADVAVHLARKQGQAVPEHLLVIRDAGREATRELRATLETLRRDLGNGSHGLDQLADLVEGARMSGLEATLAFEGDRTVLPAAVDRTGYRIVQESLTNVARHAEAKSASVLIRYRPDTVVIRVDDDGIATPEEAPVAGIGLRGMHERVAALGGRLQAAPRACGGFSVRAELPLRQLS